MFRRCIAALLVAALLGLVAPAPVAGAQTAPRLVDIRTASGAGFDRVVFEFSGALPEIRTVAEVDVILSDPVSWIVPVAGQARLRVRLGMVEWLGVDLPSGGPSTGTQNVVETRFVDSFEGMVTYGIGLRHRASFWSFTLSAPNRLVVDIGHAALPTVDERAGTIYGVGADGTMRWYRHADPERGGFSWATDRFGEQIGDGWDQPSPLVAAGGGVFYGVDGDGNLRWYRHDDPVGGTAAWTEDNFGAVVGTGWDQFTRIVPDGFGTVYTVDPDGTLRWYRHIGRDDGTFNWEGGSGTAIGDGFDACEQLFSGGPGILYCVRADGSLQWWRHIGSPEIFERWAGGGFVGDGWDTVTRLWSGGRGTIYAVDGDGNLRWYRHLGSETGTPNWEVANFGAVIGAGWGDLAALLTGGLRTTS